MALQWHPAERSTLELCLCVHIPLDLYRFSASRAKQECFHSLTANGDLENGEGLKVFSKVAELFII